MNSFFARVLSLMIVSFAFLPNADAGLVTGDGSAQIVYGQQYADSVLSFQVQDEFGVWKPYGSAVVIDRAANGEVAFTFSDHSLISTPGDPSSRFSAYRVGVGNYFTGPTQQVTDFVLHPNAIGQINGFSYGFGFLSPSAFTESLLPVSLYNGTVMVGQESDIVGYGVYQQANSTDTTFTGDLSAGSNLISNIGYQHPNYIATRFYEPDISPLAMGGSEFDSGGGLLINGQLAGVSTFNAGNPFYGSFTGYNIIDHNLVDSTLANRSSTAVPEPSSILLFSLATCIGFLKRRRLLS